MGGIAEKKIIMYGTLYLKTFFRHVGVNTQHMLYVMLGLIQTNKKGMGHTEVNK